MTHTITRENRATVVAVCFDSFKGCMSAEEVCAAAAEGVREAHPEATVVSIPLSDGGEGLVACVRASIGDETRPVRCTVHDPLMRAREARYLISADGRTAYTEMAAAAGLTLLSEDERDPMVATTYGVGELIADAARQGCREIIIGLGGSATCDGGRGMLRALEDAGAVTNLPHITIASDVQNPLYGEEGAAYVFAPQKGATPDQVRVLDDRLRSLAREAEEAGLATRSAAMTPGAGAAGGLGYGLMVYLGAEIKRGIDVVLDMCHFEDRILQADVVLTGEGKSDRQTLMGKVPQGVLRRAKALGKQVWLLSGAIDDADHELGRHFDRMASINEGDIRPLNVLMQKEIAATNMRQTVARLLM